METGSIFLSLVLILLFARVFGEAAAWLKVPSVRGEMLAGIILGPSLLGWVELNDVIQALAEIGLILSLFEVGLDTDISKLAKHGYKASVVAIGGFVNNGSGGNEHQVNRHYSPVSGSSASQCFSKFLF